jgi:hypothetical protein
LGLAANGGIDNFNDLRVIFDPYRKRIWAAATGTCRTAVDTNGDGTADAKCALAMPESQRRMVLGLPVPQAGGGCAATGLTAPGGVCSDSLIQTTLAHADPGGAFLASGHRTDPSAIMVWKVTDLLQPTQQVKVDVVHLPGKWRSPAGSVQKGGTPTNLVAMSGGATGVALKSVWAKFALFLVVPDATTSGRSTFRILRLPTPADNVPFDLPDPPNGGARQIIAGETATQSYGWPAIEVNKDGDAVIVYTAVGSQLDPSIRYNAWLGVHPAFEPELQPGRYLKLGEAALDEPLKDGTPTGKPSRWGDLAGAAVDFDGGKEAAGIWIVHEYTTAPPKKVRRALWVGKIFGKPDADG